MEIRTAGSKDVPVLLRWDRHISRTELENSIRLGRVYIAEREGRFAGWLRYGLFWDNTPFMNLLCLLEEFRGQGYGTKLVRFWEDQMKKAGYSLVMTSTVSSEQAQHFYYRLGYEATGGFCPPGEPYELILARKL